MRKAKDELGENIDEEVFPSAKPKAKKKREYRPNPLLIPVAIIVAGALVGGAIIYNGRAYTQAVNAASSATATTSTNSGVTTSKVTFSLDGGRFQGNKNAKVGFIEFGDFQCPYCQQIYQQTIPSLRSDYVQKSKVLYGFFDFPLTEIHQYAQIGAEAGRCAGEQGQFWQMFNALYTGNQDTAGQTQIDGYAKTLGLNMSQFDSCLTSGKYDNAITTDTNLGNKIGVTGTPTVIVGKINHKNNTITGEEISGAEPYTDFQTALNQYLNS